MNARVAAPFFLTLAATLLGGLVARLALEPDVQPTAILAALAAVGAIVQSVVAVLMMRGLRHAQAQAAAATAQLALMEQTTEHQLRAYVDVKNIELETIEEGQPIRIALSFRNTGQTRATDVYIEYRCTIAELGKFISLRMAPLGDPISTTTLGSGSEMETWVALDWTDFAEHRPLVDAGEMVIGVLGCVSYIDTFNRPRTLNFHFHWDRSIHPTKLIASPAGNTST